MTICAFCGHENDDAVSFCSECTTPLELEDVAPVDLQLTSPDAVPEPDLVVVAKFAHIPEANLLKLRLESAGIDACIPEQVIVPSSSNTPATTIEQVSVRVAAKDYAAAVQVMQHAPGAL